MHHYRCIPNKTAYAFLTQLCKCSSSKYSLLTIDKLTDDILHSFHYQINYEQILPKAFSFTHIKYS
jgi:phage gp36-like protein